MNEDNMNDNYTVRKIYSSADDIWAIEFDDDVVLHCAKAPLRDDARVDRLIARHADKGDDPEHNERMQAMIAAVRDHEKVA